MKILVIAMAGIGDTLIATPLIHELRANFPDAQIDVLTMWAGARDLLEGNPHVNRVWQKNMITEGALKTIPFLMQLRRERYDVSLNAHTQGRIHYRIIARIIGAKLRVSHRYEGTPQIDRLLVQKTIREDYSLHSIEQNNRLLPLIGAQPRLARHDMEIYLGPAEEQWADNFLAANQLGARQRLGIHVGSGTTKNLALKRWPVEQWIELLQRLAASHPQLAVLMFGGPGEQAAHARIQAVVRSPNVFAPETKNFRQAAALIRRCDAFLSVDTVMMHVAAAVEVPNQIIIEAPTLNPTNVPHGNPFTLIRNPAVNGRNLDYYRYDGGPIKGRDEELIALMQSVTVDEVYSIVAGALR